MCVFLLFINSLTMIRMKAIWSCGQLCSSRPVVLKLFLKYAFFRLIFMLVFVSGGNVLYVDHLLLQSKRNYNRPIFTLTRQKRSELVKLLMDKYRFKGEAIFLIIAFCQELTVLEERWRVDIKRTSPFSFLLTLTLNCI